MNGRHLQQEREENQGEDWKETGRYGKSFLRLYRKFSKCLAPKTNDSQK